MKDKRCGNKGVVSRIQCRGDNCDNMKFWCSPLIDGWKVNTGDLATSNWFSEEQGARDCGSDRVIYGFKCRGRYCDDVNLVCVKLQKLVKSAGRDWYISKNHGGCDVDAGWLTVDSVNNANNEEHCPWERASGKTQVQYAPGNVAKTNKDHAVAKALEVYGVRYGEWTLAYKMGTLGGQFNLMDSFNKGGSIGVGNAQASDPADPRNVYRSPVLDVFMKTNKGGRVKIELYGGDSYFKMSAGDNYCPEGTYPVASRAACIAAAKALGVGQETERVWEGEAPDVPPYCSWQSGGDQAVHMNWKWEGKNSGGYTPICRHNKVVKTIEFLVNAGQAADHAWMQVSNVIRTDWAGIKPGFVHNFFSLEGDNNSQRRFFINHNYDGCEVDSGWMVVQSYTRPEPCPWEAAGGAPFIYYSPSDDNVKYVGNEIKEAQSFALYVSFDTKMRYTRKAQACVNGANLQKYQNKTVKECAELCTKTEACKAFEYGVPYGGGDKTYKTHDCNLNSKADPKGCDGKRMNLDLYTQI